MKTAVLTYIIILFTALNLFSQAYQPIPADSVYWVEVEYGPDGGSCIYYNYKYIYPAGNVVIQGNIYTEYRANSIFEYVPVTPPWFCPQNQTTSNQFYAFLRNDSLNKKVYLYDTVNLHQDILIYDFTMSVGDTVNPTSGICACSTVCPYDTFVVNNIDSVDIGGEYRKRFSIVKVTDPGADTVYHIEGIGSNFGLAYNYYCPVEISTNLVCYHYKNYAFTPMEYIGSPYCITTLNVPAQIPTSQNIIIPYTTNTFYINNEQNNCIQFMCFDVLGKQLMQKTFYQSGIIDLGSLVSGVYYMYIWFNGQVLSPYKFYVQN